MTIGIVVWRQLRPVVCLDVTGFMIRNAGHITGFYVGVVGHASQCLLDERGSAKAWHLYVAYVGARRTGALGVRLCVQFVCGKWNIFHCGRVTEMVGLNVQGIRKGCSVTAPM
jgi:hypothetical protein